MHLLIFARTDLALVVDALRVFAGFARVQTAGAAGDAERNGEDERGESGGKHEENADRRPQSKTNAASHVAKRAIVALAAIEETACTGA